jgi:hypothetical protein
VEDRYWKARIRHFVSADDGETWEDCCTAIDINENKDAFNSYVIWSGSVLTLEDGRVLAAYTGLQ